MAIRGEPSRWLAGLLAVVVADGAIGAGVWLLCLHAWHWPRADVIAITAIVVVVLAGLGVAPVTSWAAQDAKDRMQPGVGIYRARARKGGIKVKANDSVRIERSKAATDIDVTMDRLPATEAPERRGESAQ